MEIKRRSEIVKKVLFVILAVLMMVGLISGVAFAESKFTGFEESEGANLMTTGGSKMELKAQGWEHGRMD